MLSLPDISRSATTLQAFDTAPFKILLKANSLLLLLYYKTGSFFKTIIWHQNNKRQPVTLVAAALFNFVVKHLLR